MVGNVWLASLIPLTFVFLSDPASMDLEQMDLQMLCDGLRRYLQDLPQPIIPSAIYNELIRVAQGEILLQQQQALTFSKQI